MPFLMIQASNNSTDKGMWGVPAGQLPEIVRKAIKNGNLTDY